MWAENRASAVELQTKCSCKKSTTSLLQEAAYSNPKFQRKPKHESAAPDPRLWSVDQRVLGKFGCGPGRKDLCGTPFALILGAGGFSSRRSTEAILRRWRRTMVCEIFNRRPISRSPKPSAKQASTDRS